MSDANPSAISHVSLGTNEFERSVRFYDAVLATLGCKRIMQHPGAAAWGVFPEFWVQTPIDGRPASVGNGTHIGFMAADKAQVHAFPYYGCFVRDPDGHKIEAAYRDMALVKKLYMDK